MTNHVWRTPQEALLRREYEERGPTWCAKALGIDDAYVVMRRAKRIGLRSKCARGRPFAHGHDARRKMTPRNLPRPSRDGLVVADKFNSGGV